MNTSQNSLCREVGHAWKLSTSDSYRVCQRTGCRAAQQWRRGTWQDASTSRRTRKQPGEPDHLLLWDDHTLLAQGLHPRQREIEREAEQRYQFLKH